MTTPIITQVNYDNSAQRWRHSSDGRFVSESAVNAEMFKHSDATHSMLESLTQRLYAGQLQTSQWQAAVAQELKSAHLAQAMFAAGGRANMNNAAWGRVGQTLKEQYGFLNRFAQQIAAGQVSEAQALARIQMYGNAATQSYWSEYAERSTGQLEWQLSAAEHCAGCVSNANGSPYTRETLPNYPGDGGTECLSNCKCTLSRI